MDFSQIGILVIAGTIGARTVSIETYRIGQRVTEAAQTAKEKVGSFFGNIFGGGG